MVTKDQMRIRNTQRYYTFQVGNAILNIYKSNIDIYL